MRYIIPKHTWNLKKGSTSRYNSKNNNKLRTQQKKLKLEPVKITMFDLSNKPY